MDGWISVKDRDNLSKNVKVMAWMPLPEPPRMEGE